MIFSKKLIPEVYSDSYDMSIFTGLLDLIYNAADFNAIVLKALHAPTYCFKEDLSHLASCFNLQTQSRELLRKYRHLIAVKGTSEAIRAAIFLCGAQRLYDSAGNSLFDEDVVLVPDPQEDEKYDPVTKTTVVTYYAQYKSLNEVLLGELLARLAPVNVSVIVKPIELKPVNITP